MKILILAMILASCGQEGEKDEVPETLPVPETEEVRCDTPSEPAQGDAGPEGPQGTPGPQGQQGMDGSNCRVFERVVYNDEGQLRENRCDVYLKCGEDKEIFVTRKKKACP